MNYEIIFDTVDDIMGEPVLLIHGLAESSFLMMPAACALRLAHYTPVFFDYPSTQNSVQEIANHDLREKIRSLRYEEKFHIVAHSLGAVLLRYYLQDHEIPNLGRVVMMAPGNKGSPALSLYKHIPLFGPALGPSGIQSADDEDSIAHSLPETISAETGIIAGCLSLDPVSFFSMRWPHDGKITVEGTKLDNMKDHITLPTSHDTMLFDPAALYQAVYFLQHGHFNQPWQFNENIFNPSPIGTIKS